MEDTPSNRYFDKIADEIWLLIFLASIEDHNPKNFKSPNPFILSAVCKDWRRIALANTVLWDTPSLFFEGVCGKWGKLELPSISNERVLLEAGTLKLWIERAGTRPLSITAWNWEQSYVVKPDEVAKVLPKIIVQHASRIVSLDLHIFSEWSPLFKGVRFPRLRELKLFVPEIASWGRSEPLCFNQCPDLSVVQVNGNLMNKGLGVALPWSQITDAGLSYLGPQDCMRLLSLAHDGWDCIGESGARQRGSRTRLTSLKLTQMAPGTIQKILNALPPTLEKLYLGKPLKNSYTVYQTRDEVYASIFKFIPQFTRTLRSLTLESAIQDMSPFVELFPHLPGLEKLDIFSERLTWDGWGNDRGNNHILDDEFFLRCFGMAGVLPRLLSLKFTASGVTNLEDKTILKILRHRWQVGEGGCIKIQHVCLAFPLMSRKAALGAAVKGELKEMIEGGLNLAIESRGAEQALSLIWDRFHAIN